MFTKKEKEMILTLIVAYIKTAKLTYKDFTEIQKIIEKLQNED